jgi:hypothetical protein
MIHQLPAPIRVRELMLELADVEFKAPDGRTQRITATDEPAIVNFLEASPIVLKRPRQYYLIPLESEVDVFGGLYMGELASCSSSMAHIPRSGSSRSVSRDSACP